MSARRPFPLTAPCRLLAIAVSAATNVQNANVPQSSLTRWCKHRLFDRHLLLIMDQWLQQPHLVQCDTDYQTLTFDETGAGPQRDLLYWIEQKQWMIAYDCRRRRRMAKVHLPWRADFVLCTMDGMFCVCIFYTMYREAGRMECKRIDLQAKPETWHNVCQWSCSDAMFNSFLPHEVQQCTVSGRVFVRCAQQFVFVFDAAKQIEGMLGTASPDDPTMKQQVDMLRADCMRIDPKRQLLHVCRDNDVGAVLQSYCMKTAQVKGAALVVKPVHGHILNTPAKQIWLGIDLMHRDRLQCLTARGHMQGVPFEAAANNDHMTDRTMETLDALDFPQFGDSFRAIDRAAVNQVQGWSAIVTNTMLWVAPHPAWNRCPTHGHKVGSGLHD